jgi:hypothetical protein
VGDEREQRQSEQQVKMLLEVERLDIVLNSPKGSDDTNGANDKSNINADQNITVVFIQPAEKIPIPIYHKTCPHYNGLKPSNATETRQCNAPSKETMTTSERHIKLADIKLLESL